MTTKFLATTAASLALVATPVVAQATTADRASAPAGATSEMGGSNMLIAILAAAAIIAGIIIAADNEDDTPASA